MSKLSGNENGRRTNRRPSSGNAATHAGGRARDDVSVFGGRWLDLATVLACTLLFCLLVFAVLRYFFPEGTGLGQFLGSDSASDGTGAATGRSLAYGSQHAADANGDRVATLFYVQRDVRVRHGDSLAWSGARDGIALSTSDAVQTFARSRALVHFAAGERLEIGADSLIVLQAREADHFVRRRQDTLLLVEGSLSGTIDGAASDGLPLEVAIANARVTFDQAQAGGEIAFELQHNPDDTASLSILSGSARVTSEQGAVTVGDNVGITLAEDGRVIERRRLPDAPQALSPGPRERISYRDVPPVLSFDWHQAADVAQYRFRLAADERFETSILDERVQGNSFSYGNLPAGTYYWKVSGMSGWQEGAASEVRVLHLARDDRPPALELDPGLTVDDDAGVLVRGRTEPGATVYVQGEPVELAGGAFEVRVGVPSGTSLLVVEAVDAVGNVAYLSHLINASANGSAR